jgi:hypothetical protein
MSQPENFGSSITAADVASEAKRQAAVSSLVSDKS